MKELYIRNGIYHISFYVRDKRGNLVRRRKTTGTRDFATAQRVARNLLVSLTNDTVDPHRPRDISIAEAFDLLMAASKHRAAKTVLQYDLVRRKVLGLGLSRHGERLHFIQPHKPLSDLATSDIEAYVASRTKEGLSANSVNVELRVIRRVVKLAQRDGFIVNPKLRIAMLGGSVRKRKFSVQEEIQILNLLSADGGASASKAMDLFIFLLDTGVRLNEALQSEWSDFDLRNRTFEVHRTKTSSISSLSLTRRVHAMLSTKTNQPMPFFEMDRAVKCLRKAIDQVCNTPRHSTLIARDGRAVIHSCRDTFATRLISAGLTLYEGSKLLGHSSQHMTAKYSHLESRDIATRAASLLER